MRKWCRFWGLALGVVQLARVQAQPLPPGAPPVPPDTEQVERERAVARPPTAASKPAAATPAAPAGGPADGPKAPPAAEPAGTPEVPAEPVAPSSAAEAARPPPAAATSASAPPAATDSQPSAAPEPLPAAGAPSPPAAQPPAASAAPQPSAAAPTPLWSAAALLGLGVTFDNTAGSVNPLGFGFGLRGDYRIAEPWAVGARVLYFVGGSSELPAGRVSMQTWLIAVEGAYVLRLDPLLIQPGLALGLHMRQIDERVLALTDMEGAAARSQNRTQTGIYLAPGLNIALPLGNLARELDYLVAGMDIRLDLAFGSRLTSNLQLLFMAGVRF